MFEQIKIILTKNNNKWKEVCGVIFLKYNMYLRSSFIIYLAVSVVDNKINILETSIKIKVTLELLSIPIPINFWL